MISFLKISSYDDKNIVSISSNLVLTFSDRPNWNFTKPNRTETESENFTEPRNRTRTESCKICASGSGFDRGFQSFIKVVIALKR